MMSYQHAWLFYTALWGTQGENNNMVLEIGNENQEAWKPTF